MRRPFLPLLPFFIKYPFLRTAGKFIESEYSLEDILNSNDGLVKSARKIALRNVKLVLDGKRIRCEYPRTSFLCSECELKECNGRFENCNYRFLSDEYEQYKKEAKHSILVYLFSKIIVSNLDEVLRRKYAIREARRYRKMLEEEDCEFLKFLASDFDIRADYVKENSSEFFRVFVTDYIKGSVGIKADNWKLVNRMLKGGFVYLNKKDFVRLIEEFLKKRLEEKVDVKMEVKLDIGIDVEMKREIYDLPVDAECYPKCMKKILLDLKNGLNVPHSARFSIASFLLNIGLDIDRVVDVFRTAPDFDEDKTRYQVEHIAGRRGKGQEYSCPSCDTMRSYGLCSWECGVSHPIEFYRRCLNERGRDSMGSSKRKRKAQDNV